MPKIKNWSRKQTLNTDYVGWQHDNKNHSVRVLYYDGPTKFAANKEKGYYVIHNFPPSSGKPAVNTEIIADGFSSEKRARKVAVNWMKKNPSP